jgi:hypothetical protein
VSCRSKVLDGLLMATVFASTGGKFGEANRCLIVNVDIQIRQKLRRCTGRW